jgi:hypothetical protein
VAFQPKECQHVAGNLVRRARVVEVTCHVFRSSGYTHGKRSSVLRFAFNTRMAWMVRYGLH